MTRVFAGLRNMERVMVLSALLALSMLLLPGCGNVGSSLDTGKVVKGFTPSGQQNAKWMYMSDDAVIILKSGNEGKLYFKGLVDQNLFHSAYGGAIAMTFVVNGDPVKVATINKVFDGYFDVVCDVPKNKKIEVHIKSDRQDASRKDGAKVKTIAYSLEAR